MTTPIYTTKTYGPSTSNGGEQIASALDSAAKSAQHAVDGAADSLSKKVDDIRSQAKPVIDRLSDQAEAAAATGMDALRDSSQQLRERAGRATDVTIAYVKDEPVKSVLIAAATGALLMGMVGLVRRAR